MAQIRARVLLRVTNEEIEHVLFLYATRIRASMIWSFSNGSKIEDLTSYKTRDFFLKSSSRIFYFRIKTSKSELWIQKHIVVFVSKAQKLSWEEIDFSIYRGGLVVDLKKF